MANHLAIYFSAGESQEPSGTRIPGLVREHRADKAKDDIRNSARTKGCVLKTRRIPRTLSALLLVELSIQGFYWIFATLAHAQNKSWCSRTNPDTRVLVLAQHFPHSPIRCHPPPPFFSFMTFVCALTVRFKLSSCTVQYSTC